MIEEKKIAEIVQKLALGYDPEKIILFGSYAKGMPNENSDLDLFIIKNSNLSRPDRAVEARRFLYGSAVPIDLIVYTPSEILESKKMNLGFVNEVLNSGKTLYERAN